jgi:hypothetical protein
MEKKETNSGRANAGCPQENCSLWRPIEDFDRSEMQLVLVTEEGAVRLHLWNPYRQLWERPYPIGSIVLEGQKCHNPTHWMAIPIHPR